MQIPSPIQLVAFFCRWFFCCYCCATIKFNVALFIYFCLYFFCLVVKFTKTPLRPRSLRLEPMFSSMYLTVSGLIVKRLIHFELIFVYGVSSLVSFFRLYFPVLPPLFTEEALLSLLYILGLFVKN